MAVITKYTYYWNTSSSYWFTVSNWTGPSGAPTADPTNIASSQIYTIDNSNSQNPTAWVAQSNSSNTIINSGEIYLASGYGTAQLYFQSGSLTLTGGGLVLLSDNVGNQIWANYPSTLNNDDNTIQGAGRLFGPLTVNNGGTIDGSYDDNALTIQTGVTVNNTGLMEGTNGTITNGQITKGGLVIAGQVNQTGTNGTNGTIEALSGGAVTLENAVTGGAITVDSGGTMAFAGSAQFTGGTLNVNGVLNVSGLANSIDATNVSTNSSPTITGQINIADNAALTLGFSTNNAGTISLNAATGSAALYIGGANGTVDLTGRGTVALSDNAGNSISGPSGGALDNVTNTIQGAGQITSLTLTNGGTIDASGTNNQLVFNNLSGVVNSGTIESTGAAGLKIVSASINNLFALIEANAASASTSVAIQGSLISGGTIEANGSSGHTAAVDSSNATFTGVSLLAQNGGSITFDTSSRVDSGSSATLASGGSITFQGNASFGGGVTFSGSGDTLSLSQTGVNSGLITGFASTDKIDLTGISGGAVQSQTVVGGNLQVVIGNATTSETLSFAGTGLDGTFSVGADTAGTGTLLETAQCFCPGTLVATEHGETPVEELRIGDCVRTAEGETRPIAWIGRCTIATRFADPMRCLPIRVKAGALAERTPSRDLLISPDHALMIDGVLIHAGALVNGASIVRETRVPEVFVYYHVELHDHSLILAENAAAETFVDNVDRFNFDNWAEHEALYPDGKPLDEMPYPRAKSWRQVPARIRAMLGERAAALSATADAAA